MDEVCELGSPLRAHVVWFGEDVPLIGKAAAICQQADIFILIGTSLNVYPAAGLIDCVAVNAPKYIIDPHISKIINQKNIIKMQMKATMGVLSVFEELMSH